MTNTRTRKKSAPRHHGHSLEEALVELKKSGLKLTTPRKAILKVLVDQHGPFTVEEIHQQMNKRVCDQVTVYRSLSHMEELGLVRRCEFGDGSARFEWAGSGHGHHHHLVCNVCKRVEILDDEGLEEVDRFAKKRGYTHITHLLEFFGTCPQCQ